VLKAEGIPIKTFALGPARANLVARIKGNGSKRPLPILADTETATSSFWRNLAKRRTRPASVSTSWSKKHYDEIDAEFSLTEFGGGTIEAGKVVRMDIGAAEKAPARVRLVATGTSGHGSAPRTDNALIHLGAAVAKVGRWQTPMRLNDTTRTCFERLATISPAEVAAQYSRLFMAESAEASQRYLQNTDPQAYSMLRTSVVPTMLKAGVGVNVIPLRRWQNVVGLGRDLVASLPIDPPPIYSMKTRGLSGRFAPQPLVAIDVNASGTFPGDPPNRSYPETA
jgi:hypothetical protein